MGCIGWLLCCLDDTTPPSLLTTAAYTIVTVVNISANDIPFEINGVAMYPKLDAKVGGKRRRTNGYILKNLDQITFPHSHGVVFTFYQGQAHQVHTPQPDDTPKSVNSETQLPLFKSKSSYAVHRLPHWTINNVPLGKGSFGEVHLATHSQAAWLQVACKRLRSTADYSVAKSLTEVKVLIGLNHPNVNTILDIVDEPPTNQDVGRIHIVLELMAGGDLFSYIEKHQELPETETRWIAYQLVAGLKYIHEKKVAHRDIKPENIFLSVSAMYPRIVIGDFGQAITYDEIYDQTPDTDADSGSRTFPVVGTMSFIPPERLKIWSRPRATLRGMVEDVPKKRLANGKYLSRRHTVAEIWLGEETKIDSWSLGVTLFVVAIGGHPYDEGQATAQQPTTLAAVTQRRSTSRQAWDRYRSTVGESHRLGTSAIGAHGAEARGMLEKCRGFNDWSFRSAWWRDWSKEGCDFMRKLFAPRPEKRPTMVEATQHKWFKDDEAALENLYDRVVMKGEVLNPASALQVRKSATGKSQERLFISSPTDISPSSTSQATIGLNESTLYSVPEADEDIEMS